MQKKDIKKLPSAPGVYMFKKKRARSPLYVGKATSLKDRVKSYFNTDIIKSRGPAIVKMVEEAQGVDFIRTDSVLEALVLESEMIKKFKPKYNVKERDDKSFNYIATTKEEFPIVQLVRGKELFGSDHSAFRKIFGPYPNPGELKVAMNILRKIFPWRDKKCEVGQGKPCFSRQIGLCPGVCTGEATKTDYLFTVRNLELFLTGGKKEVVKNYEKKMKTLAKMNMFERAGELRNKIFALNHIQDIALLKKEQKVQAAEGDRIEAYDIAHSSGGQAVGVMVVLRGGRLLKSEYRKFKIRSGKGWDDTGNLREVLQRRFNHPEWTFPKIVVVDGGTAQVNAAMRVISGLSLSIHVASVIKDECHKAKKLTGPAKILEKFKDDILLINEEAHRFAISYHRHLRQKAFKGK